MKLDVDVLKLKEYYDSIENKIKTDAVVSRAYTDRLSTDAIEDKVNSEFNSITAQIKNINHNFGEGSKKYDLAKKSISETMANYQENLLALSRFYDQKIEQLILSKVELESGLLGGMITKEYLDHVERIKTEQKENDIVKERINDATLGISQKIAEKKENGEDLDPIDYRHLVDANDIQAEIDISNNKELEKTKKDKEDNIKDISDKEAEIKRIEDEIAKMNERKVKALLEAMEEGDKFLSVSVKKPRTFTRIKRFIVSRFNTYKVINDTIITPLNNRIEDFKKNELTDMKG